MLWLWRVFIQFILDLVACCKCIRNKLSVKYIKLTTNQQFSIVDLCSVLIIYYDHNVITTCWLSLFSLRCCLLIIFYVKWKLCIFSPWPSLATWIGSTLPQLARIDLSRADVPLNTKQTNVKWNQAWQSNSSLTITLVHSLFLRFLVYWIAILVSQ